MAISMLSNTLNTNEIKNSAGTEQEFSRLFAGERDTEFSLIGESPALQHRLKISHQEIGAGIAKRRRSVVQFRKDVVSTIDNVTPVTIKAQMTLDAPVGALAANAEIANVLANLISFCASSGANTTILYDCTGNGANALLTGSL